MHPTLLPEGRGRAPIPWTIVRSLNSTGVTAFLLEEEPDAGGIILQRAISVDSAETATTLFEKIGRLHEELGEMLIETLASRNLCWIP